jgi:hypothetical protein
MRDLLTFLAWMTGALAVIGFFSWLLIHNYPDAIDAIPDDGEADEMGAPPVPKRRRQRRDAA